MWKNILLQYTAVTAMHLQTFMANLQMLSLCLLNSESLCLPLSLRRACDRGGPFVGCFQGGHRLLGPRRPMALGLETLS